MQSNRDELATLQQQRRQPYSTCSQRKEEKKKRVRNTCARSGSVSQGGSKRHGEESIFKKEDVDRMFSSLPAQPRVTTTPFRSIPPSRRSFPSAESIAEQQRVRVVLIYGNRPADLRISNSRLRGSMRGWARSHPTVSCVYITG